MQDVAVVNAKGRARWDRGHPWIYRSDVTRRPETGAGVVCVQDSRGKPIGSALWSPASEISLRLLDRDARVPIDAPWWRHRVMEAIARRAPVAALTNAYRLVHGEADGCPSLICDRYDRCPLVQRMS